MCHLPCCVILSSSNDQVHSTVVSVSACCHGFVDLSRLELRFLGLCSLEGWLQEKLGQDLSGGSEATASEHYVLKLGVRAGVIATCMHWH